MNEIEAILQQAEALARDGRLDEMNALFEALFSVIDDTPKTAFLRGKLHWRHAQLLVEADTLDDALSAFQRSLPLFLDGLDNFPIEMANGFAGEALTLGNALYEQSRSVEAVIAYDAAIKVMEKVRDLLEPAGAWTPALRNDLATAYTNKGNVLQSQGHLDAAVTAYDAAIKMGEAVRDLLEPAGAWTPALRNDLAIVNFQCDFSESSPQTNES
jgi:tetratricopeptide (TPR) repeat protein